MPSGSKIFPWCSSVHGKLRLFCFPYAGAPATVYRPWIAALEPEIAVWSVEYPGHGTRLREPLSNGIRPLAQQLAAEISRHSDQPYAFFGHSMGALVAYEVALQLTAARCMPPRALVLSACGQPDVLRERERRHRYDDQALIGYLIAQGGTPPSVLADLELLRAVLPVVRSDLQLFETYEVQEQDPLNVPLLLLAGAQDTDVPSSSVAGWRAHATGASALLQFEGGHFFLHTRREQVIDALRTWLLAACAALDSGTFTMRPAQAQIGRTP